LHFEKLKIIRDSSVTGTGIELFDLHGLKISIFFVCVFYKNIYLPTHDGVLGGGAGQLRGGVRAVGRDAGQRVPPRHRGQHPQGDDQAAQHTPHCRQQRHRYRTIPATEANILKEMIKPPNILRTVVNSVTGTIPYQPQRPTYGTQGDDQAAQHAPHRRQQRHRYYRYNSYKEMRISDVQYLSR